ncbi:uncharacterized protein LOC105843104 isoform X2 [Hydra vulgaris]|uniref:uncharacterized protein LOC105843104 isoform X2 n=1 Tax=Hydra vulgaris TaxID=6087 RepID=UPI001F5EAA1F|nr:uncharacterized protein LOC105843104 isoform X2 [Hydra vulgaris]
MKLASNAKNVVPLNRNIKTPHYLLNRKRSLSKTVASPTFSLPNDVRKALTEVKQHQQVHKSSVAHLKASKSVSSCNVKKNSSKGSNLNFKNTPWRDKTLGRKERLQLWLSSGPRSLDLVKKQQIHKNQSKINAKPSKKKLNFLSSKFEAVNDSAAANGKTDCKTACDEFTGDLLELNCSINAFANELDVSPERKVHFEDFSPVNFEASTINLCIMESSAFKRKMKGRSCKKVVTPVRRSIRLSSASIPVNFRTDERILKSPSEVKVHLLENKIAFMPNKNLRTPLNKIWKKDEDNLNLSFLS